MQRRQACTCTVWAVPRSLATTSGISDLISFPRGTEMFQFPPFATPSLCIQPGVTWTLLHVGFPIRRSTGQRLLTAHRRLSQFYHVLLRLLVPRHPPNALTSLTTENVALSTAPNDLRREPDFTRYICSLESLRQMAKSSLHSLQSPSSYTGSARRCPPRLGHAVLDHPIHDACIHLLPPDACLIASESGTSLK